MWLKLVVVAVFAVIGILQELRKIVSVRANVCLFYGFIVLTF